MKMNLSKIKRWLTTHSFEISWFIIGACFMQGVHALMRGDLFGAAIAFGFAFLNYVFVSK